MPASQNRPQMSAADANAQHRLKSHEIRVTESHLKKAQQRRRQSNIAIVLGPVLIVILFELHWALLSHVSLSEAIYVPGGLLAVFCFLAWVKLKLTPGGPPTGSTGEKMRAPREQEPELELKIARLRDERKVIAADADLEIRVRRVAYRDSAYDDIRTLREESSRYRRVNNILQAILIVGSLAATGASAIIGQYPTIRWVTLGITFTVGMASGFMGYFKYKERSFYLQQTADAIESEWEALEAGVGRYKNSNKENEGEMLALFSDKIHRLKLEQKQRQQSLDQPESSGTKD
jgi:Protein of unknown function (DUF4231)